MKKVKHENSREGKTDGECTQISAHIRSKKSQIYGYFSFLNITDKLKEMPIENSSISYKKGKQTWPPKNSNKKLITETNKKWH